MGESSGQGTGSHYTALPLEDCCKAHEGTLYIPAKALSIVWGNDVRYWRMIHLPKEEHYLEFDHAAELVQVNWLEVVCKLEWWKMEKSFFFFFDVEGLEPKTKMTYEISWVIKFNVDAFGWHNAPVKFKVPWEDEEGRVQWWTKEQNLEQYMKKGIGKGRWLELPGGEFTVDVCGKSAPVAFGLFETETDWWKGGLVVAGAKIKPKNFN
ncbi:hypothetical protein H6P81_019101 [Aristolochia fimbriata]|uniref:Uncharacterized protein n=1 Tax=Aristolochia fimbriata TaxID=158543 RepID=A0AAV7DRX4_ARIFI|nr:hypothetical protein H6P81_019101 [Aristolochia fimbriata]